MSPDPNQPLQFDKAEIAGESTLACVVCKTPIVGEYYQANGQTICPNCRSRVASFGIGGSGAARMLKATAAGLGGGVVGCVIYYFVTNLTGWNIGLIAIVVGWLVGTGVRWGSEGRGGTAYQVLAAAITYVASCAIRIPGLLDYTEGELTVVKAVYVFFLSLALPWMSLPRSILSCVILAFGVYEAWILNRKVNIQVSGPFFARQATPPAAP